MVVSVVLLLLARHGGAPTGGLNPLQGEWALVETADPKRRELGDPAMRLLIKGNEVPLMVGAVTTNRGTVAVGRCDMPLTMDTNFGVGEPVRGVYELNGDVLLLCFDEPGKMRPAGTIP